MAIKDLSVVSVLGCVLVTVMAQDIDSESPHKVWSVCSNGSCSCGGTIQDRILCDSDHLYVQPCYCVYFEPEQNTTVLGNCIPTCYYVRYHDISSKNYYIANRYSIQEGALLNHDVCDWTYAHTTMHREGRFCGRCKEGYGLAAYSYHYTTCVPCRDYGYKNWLKYFAAALLPLTMFYFVVVVVKLNVPSSRLNGTVFVLQCFFSSLQLRALDGLVVANQNTMPLRVFFKFITSLFGFVNLDFFRTLYPDNCLHPKLNILHMVSLDYIVAFYPFFLIFVTYILVSLYDRNCRVVVCLWKQFNKVFKWYKKQPNIRATLVQTFATFILLSYVKVLGICFDLMVMTPTYSESGSLTSKRYLLYDANIEYFSLEHLPFALLAIVTGLLFVFLPFLLLLLYPCGCFHQCLDRFGIRFQCLHIFMDAFQGCYRTSPHDMRYFSVFYLVVRFLALWSISFFISTYYIPCNAFIFMLSAMIIAIFKPYKNSVHNHIDLVAIFSLSLIFVGFSAFIISCYVNLQQKSWGLFFACSAVIFTFLYAFVVLTYHPKMKHLVLKLISRLPRQNVQESRILESLEEDRDSYTPLLS